LYSKDALLIFSFNEDARDNLPFLLKQKQDSIYHTRLVVSICKSRTQVFLTKGCDKNKYRGISRE